MQQRQVCGRCVLKDMLTAALDDGTGRIRPELQALHDRLAAMPRPRTGILWLNKPHVPPLLHAIATGQVPLTHDGIATLSPARSATYVRRLLVSVGTLPDHDHHLDRFERWLPGWLDTITDLDQRAILTRYARWSVLRQLRAAAHDGDVGHHRQQTARSRLRAAAAFLVHLAVHDRTLDRCTQALLDRWYAHANYSARTTTRPFLAWAIRTKLAPRLRLPLVPSTAAQPISRTLRLQILRRVLDDLTLTNLDRVVATLVLLYAQPLQRLLRLRVDHITDTDGVLTITLAITPVPVPAPFDQVIRDYLAERASALTPAANPDSPWLFPGRWAGHPLNPTALRDHLRRLKIPNQAGRSRALRELVLAEPPAVIAPLLGYAPSGAERIAHETGATWQHYPGRRPRSVLNS